MTKKCEYQTRQDRNSTTFNNTYQLLGTFTAPTILFKIVNNSTIDVNVSQDGVTNHDYIPANSFTLYDVRTNHGREQQMAFPLGTTIYIKGAAAGTGSVYLVALNEGQWTTKRYMNPRKI